MDDKTKGAWLIHHKNKLESVINFGENENILNAGKAGTLLSAISGDNQITMGMDRVEALAKASTISRLELNPLLDVLESQNLIDRTSSGIAVLGVTSSSVLSHTSQIFESFSPSSSESASIYLAEKASIEPQKSSEIREEISDIFSLSFAQTNSVLADSENIGFTDAETIDKTEKLYFNGNLFRRESARKIKNVLDSLSAEESQHLLELNEHLRTSACVPVDSAKVLLGDTLFNKVFSIGLYDISIVSNSMEETGYVTLPSAFSKYSNSIVEDAFDLAKAFISSITYGMTKSSYERGQIRMVEKLLQALVDGRPVGPVNAIGEDYRVLELKGVVKVANGYKNGRSGPMMKLLKKEVGELALQVIQNGDVSEHSISHFPTAAVSKYKGPEKNREYIRKRQIESCIQTTEILATLRKGGL